MSRLREIREKQGLSQAELAERAGTSQSQIDRLEKGHRRLTVDWLNRLSQALRCTPTEILEAPKPGLAPDEQAILDLYRALSAPNKENVIRIAGALAEQQPHTNGAAKNGTS